MLRRLSVENYALIDKLEMELDPRLNIITGETGAENPFCSERWGCCWEPRTTVRR